MENTLPPAPHSRSAGAKTPESPKNPLQLGCSVTQIRHFFKRTFFNLPLIFENNVKKATVWLHERGKPLRHCFAMPPPLPRGGLGIPESFASSPEAPLLGATATTAASGGNREELLGQRPAGCKRQRSRRWVPQPGQWHAVSDDGEVTLPSSPSDTSPQGRRYAA